MTTTMNTGAASLSDEQILDVLCGHDERPFHRPHGTRLVYNAFEDECDLREIVLRRVRELIALTTTTPQADAAIAAGGAQEPVTDAKSKLPEFSGCIEWSNYRNRQGYGSFKADGKMSLAHRVMYCDYHGVTRDSIKHLVVRHACDNPSCFNPAHLLLGTHADNTKDKIERGRHARGEMNGQSKLSRHQAGQIRSLYVRGSREFGIPALAKKFGVGQSTIREVVLNLRWVETTPSNGEQA